MTVGAAADLTQEVIVRELTESVVMHVLSVAVLGGLTRLGKR